MSTPIYRHRTDLYLAHFRRHCLDLEVGELVANGDDFLPNAQAPIPPGPEAQHFGSDSDSLVMQRAYSKIYSAPGFLASRYLYDDQPVAYCSLGESDVDPNAIAEELRKVLHPVAEMSGSIDSGEATEAWRAYVLSDATPGFVYLEQGLRPGDGPLPVMAGARVRLFAHLPARPNGGDTLLQAIQEGADQMDDGLRDLFVGDAALTERAWRERTAGEVQVANAEREAARERGRREIRALVEAQRRAAGTTTSAMVAQGVGQGLNDFARQERRLSAASMPSPPPLVLESEYHEPWSGRDRPKARAPRERARPAAAAPIRIDPCPGVAPGAPCTVEK